MMKNKVKYKKFIVLCLAAIALFSAGLTVFSFLQYRAYTDNYNKALLSTVSLVKEKYPDVSEEEIMEILNGGGKADSDFFRKYGIDIREDSVLLDNRESMTRFLAAECALLVAFGGTLFLLFILYNGKRDREFAEISEYLDAIGRGIYDLDISGNSEDELSILKNDVYKITVRLREQAEISLYDKVNLKNSLSDISHQIKTPLTSIIIMLDNIRDNPDMDSAVREDFIRDIYREIQNISFLVQSLLVLSRFDANTIEMNRKSVSLKELVLCAAKNVSALCDLKNIEVSVNGNDGAKVFCDFKWQTEALANILKNCCEHSFDGGRIEITFDENSMYSYITVRDYGAGMDEKDLSHIFERFYKGKNSSKDSVGIGLALSKAIIENDGGAIKANSEKGKGTRFYIKYYK